MGDGKSRGNWEAVSEVGIRKQGAKVDTEMMESDLDGGKRKEEEREGTVKSGTREGGGWNKEERPNTRELVKGSSREVIVEKRIGDPVPLTEDTGNRYG